MAWHDRGDETITVRCRGGHEFVSTGEWAANTLRELDTRGIKEPGFFYAYGDHVSDPLALVLRYLNFAGWTGQIGSMRCPKHQLPEGEDRR